VNDPQLFDRVRRHADLKAQAKELAADADAVRDEIVAELLSRGAKAVERDGVKVTLVQREKRIFDVDALKARIKPALFRKVTSTVVDLAAVKRERDAGRLSDDDVFNTSIVEVSTPYITVTEKKPA